MLIEENNRKAIMVCFAIFPRDDAACCPTKPCFTSPPGFPRLGSQLWHGINSAFHCSHPLLAGTSISAHVTLVRRPKISCKTNHFQLVSNVIRARLREAPVPFFRLWTRRAVICRLTVHQVLLITLGTRICTARSHI